MRSYTVRQLALSTTITTGLVLGSVFYPHAASAATYHVSPAGNDANPGTDGGPFRTIARGLSILSAGDTLYVGGGTYAERIDSNVQRVSGGASWSNGDVVTVAAVPGETVVLHPSGGREAINLAHASVQYLIFDGLSVDAANVAYGISLTHGVNHVRFQNGEVKNAQSQGIILTESPGTSYNEFINLKVHSNGEHGLYIQTSYNLFNNLDVYNNHRYGISVYNGYSGGRADGNVITGCTVHDNGTSSVGGGVTVNSGDGNTVSSSMIYGNSGDGIDILYDASNTKISNNTIYNNSGYGIAIGYGNSNTVVEGNVIYQNGGMMYDGGFSTFISE